MNWEAYGIGLGVFYSGIEWKPVIGLQSHLFLSQACRSGQRRG
jgi:hypothetical protein